jgi:hypothetical protein
MDNPKLRLDDLYKMVAHIYSDKNVTRTATATFAHFVEVCGMLTIHDRRKKREGIDVTDALCKALGWYFPLLAKFRIRSVEELVFRKFPRVCPYCRSAPHNESQCKLIHGTHTTVDHAAVAQHFSSNWPTRPAGLDDWQAMFQSIYPRSVEDRGRSTIGLLEELGELAEAVRVFEVHPKYFLGEAADSFSYIMGIANEHSMRTAQEGGTFSFEAEFLSRFPGLCVQCGSKICVCPGVPSATVGRMAKELDIRTLEKPFIEDLAAFSEEGRSVGHRVLEASGGPAGLSSKLPFDRGDTNRALASLCLQISEAVEDENAQIAETLRAAALRISLTAQEPGSPRKQIDVEEILNGVAAAWKRLKKDDKEKIKRTEGIVADLADLLDTFNVLFVYCTPSDEERLRVHGELRVIKECLRLGRGERQVAIQDLPAATPTDFRRELLSGRYDLIHFAGHCDGQNLVFENETGNATGVPLNVIGEIVDRQKRAKGVILNACASAQSLAAPISANTIAMDDTITDEAAIEFSRGFYDALARDKDVKEAYAEGISSARIAGHTTDQIKFLSRE